MVKLKQDCNGFEELVRGEKMEIEGRVLFWNGTVDWEEAESG